MNDRELLELAAKAAGIRNVLEMPFHDDCGLGGWNPLTDDGDALRLAVKCKISVWQAGDFSVADHDALGPKMREPHDTDPYAATRRAIVRAAAELGKETK